MAYPDINIGSKFDAKGFKQAQTATDKLGKSVKNLAKTFGVAFSVAAIVAYGKAAAKAAAGDAKAQAILANNLKNVGLAYAQLPVEQFINNMQKQTGILDDQLRPAFARLAQVTGSVQKSQELMSNAFDISSGSGVDFSTVVDTLSLAYIGNTKGLKNLKINMTAAELKTASFTEIITQLNKQFAGAGKAAVATYGGQMQLLTAAASDAQEVIGFALLDAIKKVSGAEGVEGLTDGIGVLAEATALFIELLAKPIEGKGSWVNTLSDLITKLPGFNQSVQALAGYLGVQDIRTGYGQQSPGERAKAVAAEAAAAKRNKAVTAELKKQAAAAAALAKSKKESAALDKATAAANLALGKGTDIFDMDKIQLNAALIGQAEALGKATTGSQILAIANDVQRLKVMQSINELEDAIASKDVKRIEAATKQLNENLKILGALQMQDVKLLDINKVLASMKSTDLINLANLQAALDLLAKFKFPTLTIPGITMPGGAGGGGGNLFADQPTIDPLTGNESIEAILEYSDAVTALATVMADTLDAQNYQDFLSLVEFQKKLGDFGGYSANMNTGAGYGAGRVIVEINDNTSGLIEVVQTAVQENNRFGNNLDYAGAI